MTDKELVDWLRNCSIYEGRAFLRQSADRIEELDRHLTLSGKVGKALSDRIEALEAENERLREALEVVWKEATTMRNASKLVGPYPKEPANNRVWARSMYHAGKKLHELIKPIRSALGEKQ